MKAPSDFSARAKIDKKKMDLIDLKLNESKYLTPFFQIKVFRFFERVREKKWNKVVSGMVFLLGSTATRRRCGRGKISKSSYSTLMAKAYF